MTSAHGPIRPAAIHLAVAVPPRLDQVLEKVIGRSEVGNDCILIGSDDIDSRYVYHKSITNFVALVI